MNVEYKLLLHIEQRTSIGVWRSPIKRHVESHSTEIITIMPSTLYAQKQPQQSPSVRRRYKHLLCRRPWMRLHLRICWLVRWRRIRQRRRRWWLLSIRLVHRIRLVYKPLLHELKKTLTPRPAPTPPIFNMPGTVPPPPPPPPPKPPVAVSPNAGKSSSLSCCCGAHAAVPPPPLCGHNVAPNAGKSGSSSLCWLPNPR